MLSYTSQSGYNNLLRIKSFELQQREFPNVLLHNKCTHSFFWWAHNILTWKILTRNLFPHYPERLSHYSRVKECALCTCQLWNLLIWNLIFQISGSCYSSQKNCCYSVTLKYILVTNLLLLSNFVRFTLKQWSNYKQKSLAMMRGYYSE